MYDHPDGRGWVVVFLDGGGGGASYCACACGGGGEATPDPLEPEEE